MRFRYRRRAFTLVELLVVIGVIGVLVAILMPALRKARDSSLRTQCLSNLRQWGIVIQLYASDNRGWLPGHYHQYLFGTFQAEGEWHISEALALTYRMPQKVWFCPTSPLYNPEDDQVGTQYYWDPKNHWDSYGRATTYVAMMGNKYNRSAYYRNGYSDMVRIGKKTKPDAPIMADMTMWSPTFRWRLTNHFSGKPKGANRLLLDGSAHWREITADMRDHPATSKDANYVHPIDGGSRYFW